MTRGTRGLSLPLALVVCGATPALAQIGMPAGARQWIHVGANEGEVGAIPDPSPNYVHDPAYVAVGAFIYANGDCTAHRMRLAQANHRTLNVFAYNSMLDTYTISGPAATEGTPVYARLIVRAGGTIFVGETNHVIHSHSGGSTARIEVGPCVNGIDYDSFNNDFAAGC